LRELFILKLMKSRFHLPLLKTWRDQGIQVKLAVLLLTSTALSIAVVSYGLLEMSEQQLMQRLKTVLVQQSGNFQQQLDHLRSNHRLKASALSKQLEAMQLDLSDPARQSDLERVLNTMLDSDYEPNFYAITDATGRTIAQRTQILADWEQMLFLPQSGRFDQQPISRPVQSAIGVNLAEVAIVNDAIQSESTLASAQLVPQSVLASLGLASQAMLPIRWQPVEQLPLNKQPLPIHAINRDPALTMMAVVPIRQKGKLVGTVVIGTLFNRNNTFVDRFKHEAQVSAATLFAQDLRVATTVPYNDKGRTRAIATLASREVAQIVLQQGQPFVGNTITISKSYLTVYTPIYDHRKLTNSQAKPIGMLLVGESQEKINTLVDRVAMVGARIGGGLLLLMIVIIIPISRRFTAPIQQLTRLAKQIGQGEYQAQFDLGDRTDEVGILACELDRMTQRLDDNLRLVQESEAQVKQQAEQLAATLQELQQTQTQLIQSEKMSSLGQLVAGVAHEINNPVSFIYGNVQHAQEYTLDLMKILNLYQTGISESIIQKAIQETDLDFIIEDLPKVLNSMKMGADRIREIVLSLRTFSRLDEATFKAVDLHDGIESTLLILEHRLKAQPHRPQIQVIKHYDRNLPLVECYAGQLNQVIMNLLANAIDALETLMLERPEHQPTITITTCIKEQDLVQISVADNGTGIPESVQQRLFDPFFTTKPVGKGTGLGLSISYQIITQTHQGTIQCLSVPEMGTEFVITLPIQLTNVVAE
jgi:two-component system, NtrC family, sensor kinase